AGTITLKAGDERRADFNLVPIPALHLEVLLPPARPAQADGRPSPQPFPIVERIDSNNGMGGPSFGGGGFLSISNNSFLSSSNNGRAEISGLTPGTYRIRIQTPMQGPGQGPPPDQRSSVVQISEGSS